VSNPHAHWTIYESPIGPLTLVTGPRGLTHLSFPGRLPPPAGAKREPMPEVVDQLEAYFAGESREFDLELDLHGTPLQKAVWKELLEIPYGTTTSYGELAGRIDESLYRSGVEPYQRARAVGAANGRNPVPIVVPCHRVIGADGSLTGYGGGLDRKQALLDLERRGAAGAGPLGYGHEIDAGARGRAGDRGGRPRVRADRSPGG
jgi:methylated-DNA-[protein]-cysteine S-methyltransferase